MQLRKVSFLVESRNRFHCKINIYLYRNDTPKAYYRFFVPEDAAALMRNE